MPEFTVAISDEGLKALEAADGGGCYSFQDWIQNRASQKERVSMDRIIDRYTTLNYKRISKIQKEEAIRDLDLETAKERSDRADQQMEERLRLLKS